MTVILPNGWTGLTTGCCTDATERGQQLVAEELAFDQISSTPVGIQPAHLMGLCIARG